MWQTWFDKVSPLEYWKGRPLRWSEWCSRERVWHEIGLLITANWLSQLKSSFVKRKRMSVSQLLSFWRFFLHFINSINPFITDTIQSIILLSLKRTIILSFSEGALIIWFPLLRRIAPLFSQIYFNTWQNVSWILGLSLAKLHWRRLHRSVFALKMWVLSIICKYLLWVLTLEN